MTTPIRVLMISKAVIVGIYQRKLEHIAAARVDLRVVAPPYWKDERGITELERAYTRGYHLDVRPMRLNGHFHLHFYAGLRRVMQDFQPHIVHIDEEPYNLAAWQAMWWARRVNARTLFFSWQNIARQYPPPFSWGERWLLRHVDHALMGTESAAEIWQQKGYTGPLTVIPQFGTDTDLFKPTAERAERPFTVGYIGRLVEEKGVQVLLEAAAKLPDNLCVRILGGGPQRDELEAQAARLGIGDRVTFDAQIPSTDIPPYYHKLDALVLPSLTRPNWKEQFGRVLVEAMASGVPVVGSDSGAIPGVVGDGGLIVPEGDSEALANAMHTLMDDPQQRAELGQRGRQRVIDHFTHEQVAADTVAVYRTLAATHER